MNRFLKFWGIFLAVFAVFTGYTYIRCFVLVPAEGTKRKEFSVQEGSGINAVKVDYILDGRGGNVIISDRGEHSERLNHAAGSRGCAVDIRAEKRKVEKSNIVFSYDDTKITDEEAQNLAIAYYNEEENRMELLSNSVVDTVEHTVSVETEHFSEYVVVDSDEWYEAWAQSQLMIRDMSEAQNYFDVVFALDCSGSMEGEKNQQSTEATYQFIENLYDGDYFSVIRFNDKADSVFYKQMKEDVVSWNELEEKIMGIEADGGTEIGTALYASMGECADHDDDAVPMIVLLSDGQSDVSDEVLQQVEDSHIKVLSVGFGDDADEELLTKIADLSQGEYYKADTSDLSSVFEKIREEYIGVDLSQDSDKDGIPDKVEKTGMRNQYGTVIQTDPKNADSDGDGIPDGIEMGTVIVEDNVSSNDRAKGITKYVYFQMVSDPNQYDENQSYTPRIQLKSEGQVEEQKVNAKVTVSNYAQNSGAEESKNIIEPLKNVTVKFKSSKCLHTDTVEEVIGDLHSGETKDIEKNFVHDAEKCTGEKHIIIVKAKADNNLEVTNEIRVKGLYWYENMNEDMYMTPQMRLIQAVKHYISTYSSKQVQKILENDQYSQEEKLAILQEQKEIVSSSHKMSTLCNDDIYVAHSFQKYMEDHDFVKGTIDFSKFVFNDGIVNTVLTEPEKQRYKQLLLAYIEASYKENQEDYQVQELLNGYGEVIKGYEKLAKDLENQKLIANTECRTALDTINSNLKYFDNPDKTVDGISERIKALIQQEEILKKHGVSVNSMQPIQSDIIEKMQNEGKRLKVSRDVTNAVEDFGIVLSVTMDAVEWYNNVSEVLAVSECYSDYEEMLALIAKKTSYSELKSAAEELKAEMQDKHKLLLNEWNKLLVKTGFNLGSAGVSMVTSDMIAISSGLADVLSSVGLGIVLGKLLGNYVMGVGDMIEGSVHVIGCAEISTILSERLIEIREEFQENYAKNYEEAYQSALEYQKRYIELQQWRKLGEQSYLDMRSMDGAREDVAKLVKSWSNYEEAEEFCKLSLEQLQKVAFSY